MWDGHVTWSTPSLPFWASVPNLTIFYDGFPYMNSAMLQTNKQTVCITLHLTIYKSLHPVHDIQSVTICTGQHFIWSQCGQTLQMDIFCIR